MPSNVKDASFYLVQETENVEAVESIHNELMKHFNLDAHFQKMQNTTIPTTYHHFLRGIGEAQTTEVKGNLLSLLEGVPFDRPIEPFAENLLKQAFQVPAANKTGSILHPISTHRNGTVITNDTQREEKLKQKAKDDAERKEKKEKKKEKRRREEAVALQQVLAPLIMELRNLTWNGWIVNNKPGNPFIQKITKENCKRLGVPNYFDFVQEPMDLTRMKEQNDKGAYSKIEQFTKDLQLMVRNAMTFNRAGEPVHQMAIEIQQLYNQKLVTYQATQEMLLQERKKRKKEKKKKKSEKNTSK